MVRFKTLLLTAMAPAVALAEEPPAPSAARRDAAVAAAMRATRPRRPYLAPPVVLAAAAVVVAVAVAVPLLTRSTRHTTSQTAAGTLKAGRSPVTVADLGAVDSEGALHDLLASRLGSAGGAPPAPQPGGPAPSAGAARPGAPAAAAAPSGGAESTVTDSAVGVCEADLLRQLHRSDAPAYEAVLVWQGTPAVVFAFTSTRTEVYVTTRADCRILVFERFST